MLGTILRLLLNSLCPDATKIKMFSAAEKDDTIVFCCKIWMIELSPVAKKTKIRETAIMEIISKSCRSEVLEEEEELSKGQNKTNPSHD